MLRSALNAIVCALPAPAVEAHCDGPCGVYDPASARVHAEAVLAMTKKLKALEAPDAGNAAALATYNNTFSRFVAVKEDEAQKTKKELLILWTDYFKPNTSPLSLISTTPSGKRPSFAAPARCTSTKAKPRN